jgi:hypothetical protein
VGGASQLADQLIAPVIKTLQHTHLRNEVCDLYSFIAHVVD